MWICKRCCFVMGMLRLLYSAFHEWDPNVAISVVWLRCVLNAHCKKVITCSWFSMSSDSVVLASLSVVVAFFPHFGQLVNCFYLRTKDGQAGQPHGSVIGLTSMCGFVVANEKNPNKHKMARKKMRQKTQNNPQKLRNNGHWKTCMEHELNGFIAKWWSLWHCCQKRSLKGTKTKSI